MKIVLRILDMSFHLVKMNLCISVKFLSPSVLSSTQNLYLCSENMDETQMLRRNKELEEET